MPRKKNFGGVSSALRQVQQRARLVLVNLRKEIRVKEAELVRLRQEEATLGRLAGGGGGQALRNGRGRSGGGRTNWTTVLQQLPKQFKASDVRVVRGVERKRPSEVFAAITRWIDGGAAKRKSRGVYERV